ncbi:MAG: hypothetical protein M3332_02595 [Actinomycetota bacterium]|nr:hypothetical protein [Actinomycetota bacterium]
MAIQRPPTQSPPPLPAPPPPSRRPLITLRTALILTIGVLVGASVGVASVMTGLSLVEIMMSTGTAFAATVVFFNKIIE